MRTMSSTIFLERIMIVALKKSIELRCVICVEVTWKEITHSYLGSFQLVFRNLVENVPGSSYF